MNNFKCEGFNVGDQIEVICAKGNVRAKIGEKGIVQKINRYDGIDVDTIEIRVEDKTSYYQNWYRFKLIKPLTGLDRELSELNTMGYRE